MITRQTVRLVLAIGLVILILGALLIYIQGNTPAASSLVTEDCRRSDGAACQQFPLVTGTNLNDTEVTLPADFSGSLNFIVMAFEQEQEIEAADWLPFLQELAQSHDELRYYNIAALPALNPAIRLLITGGLSASVSDEAVRDVLILLFLEDHPAFLEALAIPDTETLALLLLDNQGRVLWQGAGIYTDELADTIRSQVNQHRAD